MKRPLKSLFNTIISIGLFTAAISFTCWSSAAAGQYETDPDSSGVFRIAYLDVFADSTVLKSPWGLSFAIDGSLYVCDRDNSSVVRFDRNGRVLSRFSGFDTRSDRMFLPVDVSASSGIEVYVLDNVNSRVFRLDRSLKNAYVVYEQRTEEEQRFGSFGGIAFDAVTGDLFISDQDNGTIVRMDMIGSTVQEAGGFGSEKTSLKEPAGLDVGAGSSLFIADRGMGAILHLPHFGAKLRQIGKNCLKAPSDVAVLPGNYLAVTDESKIVILTIDGTVKASIDSCNGVPMSPRSAAYFDGKLYVSDGLSRAVLVFSLDVK